MEFKYKWPRDFRGGNENVDSLTLDSFVYYTVTYEPLDHVS